MHKLLIDIVVVTFNPEMDRFLKLVNSITHQVRRIVIVNNGDSIKHIITKYDNLSIINLNENFGIAYATNIGINNCLNNGATYVVISDQDTIYPHDYVSQMINSFSKNIIAVAPLYIDINSSRSSFFYIKTYLSFKKVFFSSGKHYIDQAIASGLTIKLDLFYLTGSFNEDLFIDWVDFEWCWRAQSMGFKIIGNADILINHQLGDISVNLGTNSVSMRTPIRHYYITRNSFYLALHSECIDFPHRMYLFLSSFKYIIGFPILATPHLQNLRAVFRGFFDGITAKLGRY
jgi:rhamnosyltransferase